MMFLPFETKCLRLLPNLVFLGLPIEPDFPAGRKMTGQLGAGGATVHARTANGSVSIWKGRQPG